MGENLKSLKSRDLVINDKTGEIFLWRFKNSSSAETRRNIFSIMFCRFGFITSGFHERWHGKTEQDMAERADMVALKRGGDPDEAAALMIYLLSGWAR